MHVNKDCYSGKLHSQDQIDLSGRFRKCPIQGGLLVCRTFDKAIIGMESTARVTVGCLMAQPINAPNIQIDC